MRALNIWAVSNGVSVPVISGILETVKNTGCLGNSPRQHALLEYLLRESEAGRTGRVKAYSIAIDVLGRSEDFDNSVDSIVRVEMHRLRKNLALFNAGDSHFTLIIPKASYVINVKQKPMDSRSTLFNFFTTRVLLLLNLLMLALTMCYLWVSTSRPNTSKPEQALLSICSPSKPHATLERTKVIGDATLNVGKAVEINTYLRSGLSQYSKIALIPEKIDCSFTGSPSYLIQPTLFNTTNTPYVSIDIQERTSQKTIYSQTIMLPNPADKSNDLYGIPFYKAASHIAHASGVIPQDAVSREWRTRSVRENYQCQTLAYDYFVTNSEKDYVPALICLETASTSNTANPDIMGLLAIFYVEQARGYQKQTVNQPFQRAESLLQKAHAIEPFNSEVLIGTLRLEAERMPLDKDTLRNTIAIIERQHPYNAHIMIVASQIVGFKLGEWPYAHQFSQRTLALNHSSSHAVYFVEAAYTLLYADAKTAYTSAQNVYSANSGLSILINIAAANKVGEYRKSAQYKEILKAHNLYTTADYTRFITDRNYEPKLTAELIKWLEFEP